MQTQIQFWFCIDILVTFSLEWSESESVRLFSESSLLVFGGAYCAERVWFF
jgi:hypothetical protein